MTFSILPFLKNGFIKFFTDMQYFTKSEFKTENYNKHFFYSLALTMLCVFVLDIVLELKDASIFGQMYIGFFGARVVNWIREVYLENKYKSNPKAKLSWTDINFGTYGGIIGALLVALIFKCL